MALPNETPSISNQASSLLFPGRLDDLDSHTLKEIKSNITAELKESASIAQIKQTTTIEAARKLFRELNSLDNRVRNFAELVFGGKRFSNESLSEKILYATKMVCIKKNGLEYHPGLGRIIPEKDLKREYMLLRIEAELSEAFDLFCKNEAERKAFLDELLSNFGQASSAIREKGYDVNGMTTDPPKKAGFEPTPWLMKQVPKPAEPGSTGKAAVAIAVVFAIAAAYCIFVESPTKLSNEIIDTSQQGYLAMPVPGR